jgi:hypothetical protein
MDYTETNQTETSQQLIDIFYKDTYRIDSLISQINNGALQTVTTKTDKTQGSTSFNTGSVGIIGTFSASINRNTSEGTGKHIEETRKIGDDLLLKLLDQLDILPQAEGCLEKFSNLNIIRGSISLRNYKFFSQMIPLLKDGAQVFDPTLKEKTEVENAIKFIKNKKPKTQDDNNLLKSLNSRLQDIKKQSDSTRHIFENLHLILPFLPTGIGFEVTTDDGTVFTGSLKSEYLIDSEESISLNYGSHLPDRWNVLGIIDFKNPQETIPASNDVLAGLFTAMKEMSKMLIGSNSNATIIPILIYRNLDIA